MGGGYLSPDIGWEPTLLCRTEAHNFLDDSHILLLNQKFVEVFLCFAYNRENQKGGMTYGCSAFASRSPGLRTQGIS